MINDPNFKLPKDAFIRLFDNPIPAGSPERQAEGVPEWARELDEIVVKLRLYQESYSTPGTVQLSLSIGENEDMYIAELPLEE